MPVIRLKAIDIRLSSKFLVLSAVQWMGGLEQRKEVAIAASG
ncbi:hypothetical protein ACQ4M4_05085 [Leptolyngbya sp. AN02str]